MKRTLVLVLALLLIGSAFGEMTISVPDGLSEAEEQIYRNGYLAGYYAAQHGAVDERHPDNDENHYIVNRKSGKFHYPSCNGVQSMNQNNKIDFYGTREEAIAEGYTPCGMCDP